MKVVYDAVFNHVGREFPPFQDVLKTERIQNTKTGSSLILMETMDLMIICIMKTGKAMNRSSDSI